MEYIIFDLEATCWEGNNLGRVQEIIEIGAVHVDTYGTPGDTFQKFVQPIHEPTLSIYCQDLTGITQHDVHTARPFPYCGKQFMTWIEAQTESDYMLCSWGGKDQELLIQACLEASIDTDWTDPYVDLKAEYHRIHRVQRKIGLKKALLREGIEFDGAHHRALDDARNLTTIFLKHFDMWAR
jgi:inhibitor of KinA sporulation pathway (predicted exonuclease)